MKIRVFKKFYQETDDSGNTIEQFLSRAQAEDYISIHGHSLCFQNYRMGIVSKKRGYNMRRINIYP